MNIDPDAANLEIATAGDRWNAALTLHLRNQMRSGEAKRHHQRQGQQTHKS